MKNYINLFWFNSINFGDNLNWFLLKLITKTPIILCNDIVNNEHFICIGSILNWATDKSIVWGAGIANKNDQINSKAKLLMVRGPISGYIAQKSGNCDPKVYGDPALLLPIFYPFKTTNKKYKIGLIPHYTDQEFIMQNIHLLPSNLKIINVFDYPERIICDINDCEKILSSSLHGLIVADSYGIPSYRILIDNKIGGDGTKYSDYFLSVEIKPYEPIKIQDIFNKNITEIFNMIPINKPKIDTNSMLKVCPFL